MVKSSRRVIKVAMDTNVIIDLSTLYFASERKNELIQKHKEHAKTLQRYLTLIENGDMEIIILPTVMMEIEELSKDFGNRPYKFLFKTKTNFYRYQPCSRHELKNFTNQVIELSESYCHTIKPDAKDPCYKKYYINLKNKGVGYSNANTPFFRTYNHRPSLDSRIMAEATVLGLNLITHDYDFTCGNLPLRIQSYNQAYAGKKSRPYSPDEYLKIIDKKRTQKINSKEHADNVCEVRNCISTMDLA